VQIQVMFKKKIVPAFGLGLFLAAVSAQAGLKDTSPPTTPGNPRAVAASCSQIDLSWTASTDIAPNGQAASGVQGYYIYLQGNPNPVKFVPTPATSTFATALAGNSSYSFQISAVDYSNNVSTLSTVVSATTPPCPPDPPTGLNGRAPNCKRIDLSWDPPAN